MAQILVRNLDDGCLERLKSFQRMAFDVAFSPRPQRINDFRPDRSFFGEPGCVRDMIKMGSGKIINVSSDAG